MSCACACVHPTHAWCAASSPATAAINDFSLKYAVTNDEQVLFKVVIGVGRARASPIDNDDDNNDDDDVTATTTTDR